MRILVVGSGGREHTLVWKFAQSPGDHEVFCAPGNAGIAQHAHLVELDAEDIPGLAREGASQWTGRFNPRSMDEAAFEALFEAVA